MTRNLHEPQVAHVDHAREPKVSRNHISISLVITGFVGTGKTVVGRRVAEQLGRDFVDTDALIQAREGRTIQEIFATCGEDYFRRCEKKLCAELAQSSSLVIATGGGTLVSPMNRAAFSEAFVVCLDATTDALVARLQDAKDRPLLIGDRLGERLETLMSARQASYLQIELHVDTTGKSIDQVAAEIIELFQAGKMKVHTEEIRVELPDQAYRVSIGDELFETSAFASALRGVEFASGHSCVVITDPMVRSLYAERFTTVLRAIGLEPRLVEIPKGESFKTLETVQSVYDELINAQLDRRSVIFALGGGVVGDLAGFVAATFLRGVPFVQVPTTLLAMVDASIGGKVAVDHPRGKNLIGSFKQPLAVIINTATLATLPDEEWRSGMAEVVKHAIIGDPGLLELFQRDDWKHELPHWIARAIRVKVDIVVRDPFERGERAKLNLGHTFGHAFEKATHFRLRHGDAVAIGIACASRLAVRLGECDPAFAAQLERLLLHLGLPTRIHADFSAEEILGAMLTDKKRVGRRLRFILPHSPGDIVIKDEIDRSDVLAVVQEALGK